MVALIASVCGDTASLFCSTEKGGNSRLVDRDGSVEMYVKVVYVIAYIIPNGCMILFNLFGFGVSLWHIYTHFREILPFLRRLIANNIIIMMLYIPAGILFLVTSHGTALNIGSLLFSSAGFFFSISYFYFTICVDKLMQFPCVQHSSQGHRDTDHFDSESEISSSPSFILSDQSSIFDLRRESSSSVRFEQSDLQLSEV
jgi:hypothetical protein